MHAVHFLLRLLFAAALLVWLLGSLQCLACTTAWQGSCSMAWAAAQQQQQQEQQGAELASCSNGCWMQHQQTPPAGKWNTSSISVL
jgi:hypothetical protein